MGDYYKNDELSFKQIVLEHLKKILELSTEELRNKTMEVINANYSTLKYDEDTRKSYYQAVEHLAIILMPYFDPNAKEVYDECVEDMNSYNFQLKKKYQEEYDELEKELDSESVRTNFATHKRMLKAKKLFAEMNMLLKRNDYLASSVYVEEEER